MAKDHDQIVTVQFQPNNLLTLSNFIAFIDLWTALVCKTADCNVRLKALVELGIMPHFVSRMVADQMDLLNVAKIKTLQTLI